MRLKEGIDSGDLNADDRKAALLIAEWFGVRSSRPEKGAAEIVKEPAAVEEPATKERAKEAKTELVNPPLKDGDVWFKDRDYDHPYLQERGLTVETARHFGVGYHAGRGIMSGRCVIPIHNEQGELVAYAGRWPGDEGWPEGEDKYKLPPHFHKSLVVYNLHRAREHARAQGLIVCEGFFDVMHLWQCGVRNAVALMGSSMSKEQERLIVDAVGPQGRVALLLDEDPARWRCREESLARLSSQVYVKVIGLGEEGMQPDRLSEEDIKRLLG